MISCLLFYSQLHQQNRNEAPPFHTTQKLKIMYAETELMLPYFSRYPQELKHLDDFSCSQKTTGISISGYNIWGEGDLFKAPEPLMEEPPSVMGLDPMTAAAEAASMISCGEGVIQSLAVSDIESSIKSGQILSEVFYECRKDLLAAAKEGNVTAPPLSDAPLEEAPFPKSVSSCCLDSMENAAPAFLDFPVMDFESVFGMRRAFSEGDIKTLDKENNDDKNRIERHHALINSELRKEKLSRYRSKKSRRNFGRKIKYACRKALADSQPRIRGRFAKTEEATRKDFVI